MDAWKAYQPTTDTPWTIQRAVHLHRRAAFAAAWPQTRARLGRRTGGGDFRLLDGKSRLAGVPDDFEQLAAIIGQAAADSASPERLKAWWLYRCLFTPHPLAERLTLMWHNHFATSNLKVDDLAADEAAERHAPRASPWPRSANCCKAMAHDPALLVWLDAPQNRKGHPNENLARELMELFTLGIGHYTEDDVKQAARALTGWTVQQGRISVPDDPRTTTAKRRSSASAGKWSGDDLVNILLEQPATARRLAWRLTSEFFGEGVVDDAALDELADGLARAQPRYRLGRRNDPAFASCSSREANIGSRVSRSGRVRSIGPLRRSNAGDPPPSTLVLAEWVSAHGPGPVLSAQRRRLDRRPRLALDPRHRSPAPTAPRPWSPASSASAAAATPGDCAALAAQHCAIERDADRQTRASVAELLFGRHRATDAGSRRAESIHLLTGPHAHVA